MKELARAFKFVPLGSRPKSRTARMRASLQDAYARLITGLAVAALVLAAGTSSRLQRDLSGDALHAMSAVAPLPVLRSVPSHRLALEPRVSVRSSTGSASRFRHSRSRLRRGGGALSTTVAVCVAATAPVTDRRL